MARCAASVLAVAAALAPLAAAQSTVIAGFNFDGSNYLATSGANQAITPSCNVIGGLVATFMTNSVGTALALGTSFPAASIGNGTAGLQFCVPTTGYAPASVAIEMRTSSTGSKFKGLFYRATPAGSWVGAAIVQANASNVGTAYYDPVHDRPAAGRGCGADRQRRRLLSRGHRVCAWHRIVRCRWRHVHVRKRRHHPHRQSGVHGESLALLSFSSTASPSLTDTPSPSSTGLSTASLTASQTGMATPPPSASRTASGTPSRSRSPTGRRTRSGTATQTPTRSHTPTPPICRGLPAVTALVGTSGSAPLLSTASFGNAGMYTSGSCSSGYRTFFPGSRLVYALYLGDGTPLGGTLTVTNCGLTANDTVLYVGTGCPTWGTSFGCLAGADDAVPPCGANGLASTLKITAAQRNYFLQLGGVNGRDVVSGLAWAYTPPPASPSGSRSPSRSRTTTRTRSRTASRSGSRSHTRKPK
jgi:hypothetical protein